MSASRNSIPYALCAELWMKVSVDSGCEEQSTRIRPLASSSTGAARVEVALTAYTWCVSESPILRSDTDPDVLLGLQLPRKRLLREMANEGRTNSILLSTLIFGREPKPPGSFRYLHRRRCDGACLCFTLYALPVLIPQQNLSCAASLMPKYRITPFPILTVV